MPSRSGGSRRSSKESRRSPKESRRRKSSHKKAKSAPGKILELSFTVIYSIDYDFNESKFDRTGGGKFEMNRVIKNGQVVGHKYTFEFQAIGPFEKFLKKYKEYFSS